MFSSASSPTPRPLPHAVPETALDARTRALVARGDWRALVRLCERALAANDDGDRERWRDVADVLEGRVLPALRDDDERLELLFELGRIARDELGDRPRLTRLVETTRSVARHHPGAERLARRALARERRWLLARGRLDDATAHVRQQMRVTPGGLAAMATIAREAALDFVVAAPESAWALALCALWLEQPGRLAGLRPADRAALLLTTLGACADARALGNGAAWRELGSLLPVTASWLAHHLAPDLAGALQRRHAGLAHAGGLDRLLLRLERAFRRDPMSLELTRVEVTAGTRIVHAPLYQLALDGQDFGVWADLGGPMLWVEPPR